MSKAQLVTVLMVAALVAASGTYIANLQTRREIVTRAQAETRSVSTRTCVALRTVLTTFRDQEKEAGANDTRLSAYRKSLALVKEC